MNDTYSIHSWSSGWLRQLAHLGTFLCQHRIGRNQSNVIRGGHTQLPKNLHMYLRLRPARPPPDGLHSERPRAARPDPTRPRPRSPRVGEEERRLRNRQPPPVPPPRPPVFPASSGPRAAAAAVTNRSAAWRTTRSPLEMGSSTSQSQAVCRREAGARRNGRGGRGSTGAGWRRARWFPP